MAGSHDPSAKQGQEEDFDLGDLEDSSQNDSNSLVIHNMTVIADSGVDLNLSEFLNKFGNSYYEPKEFNCIRLDVRIKKELDSSSRLYDSKEFENISTVKVVEATKVLGMPKIIKNLHKDSLDKCEVHRTLDPKSTDYTSVKVSLFHNGKLSVTGARSMLSATVALEKVCRALRRRINKKARLRQITCSNILAVYSYPFHVVLPLFHKACKDSIYDPLRFSGVRVRVPINSPIVFYDLFKLLHLTNFTSKYTHLIKNENPETEESDEFESEEELVTPVQVPNVFVPSVSVKFKSSKLGIQRFVDSSVSEKRKVHHSVSQPIIKRKKTQLPKNVSIWRNTNLLSSDKVDPNDPTAKVDQGMKGMKEEVVTVNVFNTGNITFTGARSVLSLQTALSHIFPFLEISKRKKLPKS